MLLHIDDKCIERLIDYIDGEIDLKQEILDNMITQLRQKIADSRRSQKARITRVANKNLTT